MRQFDGWIPEYVTVEDVSAGRMYKFRHNDLEIDDTSVNLWPMRKFYRQHIEYRGLSTKLLLM